MKNLLVTLADENYVDQAKQLFSSVYFNAGWKGDYMLLAHKIPDKKLKWFKDKGILVKKCKPILNEKKIKDFPIIFLSKFYLFTLFFKRWKNIVFLDSDIIVRASLEDLTKVKAFAAVTDFPSELKHNFEIKKDQTISANLAKKYNLQESSFNAGVFAFNTNIIKPDTFLRLKNILREYYDLLLFGDQPVFNLFFYKKWSKFPLAYNLSPYLIKHPFLAKSNKINPVILHFIGERKPWNSKDHFNKEWSTNLKNADLIDLKNIPHPSRVLSKNKIKEISNWFLFRRTIYSPLRNLDRLLGLMGQLLRK